jgi:hypothetical protein
MRPGRDACNPLVRFSAQADNWPFYEVVRIDELVKVIRFDDFVKSPRSRRANLVSRGVLAVRRSGNEMKRNAEIGLFTKSSGLTRTHRMSYVQFNCI